MRYINVIFAIRKLATAGEQMLCQTHKQTIQHFRLCQTFFIYYPSLHYCLLCYKTDIWWLTSLPQCQEILVFPGHMAKNFIAMNLFPLLTNHGYKIQKNFKILFWDCHQTWFPETKSGQKYWVPGHDFHFSEIFKNITERDLGKQNPLENFVLN